MALYPVGAPGNLRECSPEFTPSDQNFCVEWRVHEFRGRDGITSARWELLRLPSALVLVDTQVIPDLGLVSWWSTAGQRDPGN